MKSVSPKQFEALMAAAIEAVPEPYHSRLQNIAFLWRNQPTKKQRDQLKLRQDQLLFGLYEGVPLPQRMGTTKLLPDKITLFKRPLETISRDTEDLRRRVKNTIWHEIAHYFGLDHRRIFELENK